LYGTIGGSLNISLMVDFGLNASVTYVNEDNRPFMGGLLCLLAFVYLPLFCKFRSHDLSLLHIHFLGVLYGVIRRTFFTRVEPIEVIGLCGFCCFLHVICRV